MTKENEQSSTFCRGLALSTGPTNVKIAIYGLIDYSSKFGAHLESGFPSNVREFVKRT